ncbi:MULTISPECIES: osmotically-inducible lipoprotein OsmE [Pectobacterium]|uniref:Transcriptional regulator n=2 Tax=Pectobacterium TaxID=122277 RepID=A0AA40J3C3_PECCC|nr:MULTISPECIES: osmotically-inducible lipoprotein OsmE [Pectobacterium]KAA3668466.1 osmotically-inducible lipoprotein OsmE [Pectobacterium carotovorum subsp. carotovorum]KFW99620.1 transcriptional regulator [Pectobacterium carotovorum subsp. carotovorum]KHT23252.1 transcriptional regulator [Pectobacterium carotovorum subsp. carotovorum]KHT29427.1 transcriptional regulator [Pectobacterium carotovorum subsp. carotovorum]KHT33735.1 transcriptional regulator [Pectobacterium carotovorum subsp. car
MKNNRLLVCIAAAGAVMLAGCSAYNKAESYVNEPVVKDVKVGMTKQQVHQLAGSGVEKRLVNAKGTCSDYLLKNRDGTAQNYFVSYGETGHVLNKGFQSCQAYDTNPQR